MLAEVKQSLDWLAHRREFLDNVRQAEQEGADAAAAAADDLTETLAVLRGLEVQYRERFQKNLSAIVSRAVSAVFGEEIEVKLVAKTFRDVTSLDIRIMQDGLETDIFSARGGSLVQVVAFALRVLMVASNPKLRNFIALDEPFAMVSAEYRPKVAELVVELAKNPGIQFLIITHEPELLEAADMAYEVGKKDGRATLKILKTPAEEGRL